MISPSVRISHWFLGRCAFLKGWCGQMDLLGAGAADFRARPPASGRPLGAARKLIRNGGGRARKLRHGELRTYGRHEDNSLSVVVCLGVVWCLSFVGLFGGVSAFWSVVRSGGFRVRFGGRCGAVSVLPVVLGSVASWFLFRSGGRCSPSRSSGFRSCPCSGRAAGRSGLAFPVLGSVASGLCVPRRGLASPRSSGVSGCSGRCPVLRAVRSVISGSVGRTPAARGVLGRAAGKRPAGRKGEKVGRARRVRARGLPESGKPGPECAAALLKVKTNDHHHNQLLHVSPWERHFNFNLDNSLFPEIRLAERHTERGKKAARSATPCRTGVPLRYGAATRAGEMVDCAGVSGNTVLAGIPDFGYVVRSRRFKPVGRVHNA